MALVRPPWGEVGPNHGFRLLAGDKTVGAYIAVYSTRHGRAPLVCNLAAFCVIEEHRAHSIRLVRALPRQKDCIFTDLSPSGPVPAMSERMGFRQLDTTTRLVVNVWRPTRGVIVTEDPTAIEGMLKDHDAEVFRDHRHAAGARHLLLVRGGAYAYLMYRRDRRKQLPVFASPIYAGGDRDLMSSDWAAVTSHLARRGFAMTLAERRILGFRPTGVGRQLGQPRPKMYRGDIAPEDVDYVYSELSLLQW